jgi:hypothetical protein
MLFERKKKEDEEPREMIVVDAWHVKNYPVRETLEYMEKHKLTMTRNNYAVIKEALKEKFLTIEVKSNS